MNARAETLLLWLTQNYGQLENDVLIHRIAQETAGRVDMHNFYDGLETYLGRTLSEQERFKLKPLQVSLDRNTYEEE